MANSVLSTLSRQERRILLREEDERRAEGRWGEWDIFALPRGTGGDGWNCEVRSALRNKVFAVLIRPLSDGNVHLAVASLSGVRPTWHEMQRIKDEICGPESVGVEIYPPRSEIVDGADMFHLFVGARLPRDFTIFSAETNAVPTDESAK